MTETRADATRGGADRVLLALTAPLWCGLAAVSWFALSFTGWSLGPVTPTQQLLGDLPVLLLSAACGVGALAVLAWALAWGRWVLLLGLVPALLRVSAFCTSAY